METREKVVTRVRLSREPLILHLEPTGLLSSLSPCLSPPTFRDKSHLVSNCNHEITYKADQQNKFLRTKTCGETLRILLLYTIAKGVGLSQYGTHATAVKAFFRNTVNISSKSHLGVLAL